MNMVPFFPSLQPAVAILCWQEVDVPCNEEAEVLALEREQHAWLESITNTASDLNPLGKALTMTGQETDDEDANDDSDDSDEEDEEEIDRLIANTDRGRMDTSYSPSDGQNPNTTEGNDQN
ncbi:unnamed protein product [Hermetia illucens]|uniref:Anaphase-promoting complex subunit 15 n=1 Tax=Hermetia illucens TaxID=343691 RepID=A0A7R8UL16_HERIL|nr:anaphase-promoting complex subunit 15 [Hermetia illucens]CAD7082512.1 unnamed protein product [Hermetia illucens]